MYFEKENEFDAKETLEKERKNIKSLEDLTNYIQNIKDNYNIGYGTAPRAIAQAALATAWYLSDVFGITGFQAGCVMWDFIRDWSFSHNECGLKIVDYDTMLYPQYDYKFQKTISKDTFEALQKAAKNNLETHEFAHSDVVKHWKSIVDGNVPFGYIVE